MGAGLSEFLELLDAVEDYYTTGEPRPAAARTVPRRVSASADTTAPEAIGSPAIAPAADAATAAGDAEAAAGSGSVAAARTPTAAVDAASDAADQPTGDATGHRADHAAVHATAEGLSRSGDITALLGAIATEVAACRQCGLCETRTNTVPGEGVIAPLVLVIGEGPGHEEDLSGRPFVGKAGKYLDRWLAAINLSRNENAYIANVVKCRPPNNRDPAPDESAACTPYLSRQIAVLQPLAILAVGRTASQLLTGSGLGIGAMRGQVYSYASDGGQRVAQPIPMVVTYHPSGVLRNPRLREPVWDDLRTLQRLLDTEPSRADA